MVRLSGFPAWSETTTDRATVSAFPMCRVRGRTLAKQHLSESCLFKGHVPAMARIWIGYPIPAAGDRRLMFRVVRYLPVARHGRTQVTELRAGVGQAQR